MNLPRRQWLASAFASAFGLGRRPAPAGPVVHALPVVEGRRTVASSGVFYYEGRPRRLRLMIGPSPDLPDGAPARLGDILITGDFFEVADGPAESEFAIEDVDVSGFPDRPHPADCRPIEATYERFGGSPSIVREWRPEDVPRCGLCKFGCNSWRNNRGNVTCVVDGPAESVEGDALALFRSDYPLPSRGE